MYAKGDDHWSTTFCQICCQQTSHHAEQQASMAVMLVANFPATAVIGLTWFINNLKSNYRPDSRSNDPSWMALYGWHSGEPLRNPPKVWHRLGRGKNQHKPQPHQRLILNRDQELELNIWRCSVTLQHQNVSNVATEEEREKLRKKIWEVIKPAPAS